jgi:hypothetical protein
MTIEEKVREITDSKELPENEKVDRLRALIPAEVFKIDSMSTATPAQLKELQEALAVSEAIQKLEFLAEKSKRKLGISET